MTRPWLLALALLFPTTALAQVGPNAFGYTIDTTTLDYVAPPAGAVDLALGDDDEGTVTLPWNFPWYGVDYATVVVGANGGLTFTGTDISNSNSCLPSTGFGAPDVAVVWDDLDPTASLLGGGVFWWHDTVADRLIISWEQVPFYSFFPLGIGITVQAHLYSNGNIELHYESLSDPLASGDLGAEATFGIQDLAGATPDELEWSCDTAQGALDGAALLVQGCIDGDGDGFCATDDCDDADAAINPDAAEICDDGIDQDCSGADEDADQDADTYTDANCGGDDCDDTDAALNPGVDADADGSNACDDCNDNQALLSPLNAEICEDGIDNDCDGVDAIADEDADTYDNAACGGDDCDDTDAAINPGVDADADGFNVCDECDDTDANVSPSGVEVCNGIDDDCDTVTDDVDADGDGDFPLACGGTDCDDSDPLIGAGSDPDGDGVDACLDCDETDATIYPGAPELCDGVDQDCDGIEDGQDADIGGVQAFDSDFEADDGGLVSAGVGSWEHGEATNGPGSCLSGAGCWATSLSSTYPASDNSTLTLTFDVPAGAPSLTFWHWTEDEAGFDETTVSIDPGTGAVPLGTLATVSDWTEVEYSLATWADTAGAQIIFTHTSDTSVQQQGTYLDDFFIGSVDDADLDGWVDNCPGFGDCDSTDAAIYPGAPETCGDGIDQDCDGIDQTGDEDGDTYVDSNCGGDDCDDNDAAINPGVDADADGSNVCEDCDDDDPGLSPLVPEICNDGIDQDCSGADDLPDADGDGYDAIACGGDDCNDDNALINPGVDADADGYNQCEDCNDSSNLQNPGEDEICIDFIDNDCSGEVDDIDADEDGVISSECGGDDCADSDPNINAETDGDEDGFAFCQDCDDTDAAINDDGVETCDDGIDQDCDGDDLEGDIDGDGALNEVCGGDDCDDEDAAFFPGADEICDGIDLNCDGVTEEVDADNDTFYDEACGGDDCDDDAQSISPSVPEFCDGIDNNCDGELLEGGEDDADEDGVPICDDDCDDNDPLVYPGAPEACDGIDNDCDGNIDDGIVLDADGDGFQREACGGEDCDDGNAANNPGGTEDCVDGDDNDCDGLIDEADDDCDFANNGSCEGCSSSMGGSGSAGLAVLLFGLVGLRRRRA